MQEKRDKLPSQKTFLPLFTFATSFALIVATAGYFFKNLSEFMIAAFTSIRNGDSILYQLPFFLKSAFQVIFNTSMPLYGSYINRRSFS